MTRYQILGFVPPALGTLIGVVIAEVLRANAVIVSSSILLTIIVFAVLIFCLEEIARASVGWLTNTSWFRRAYFRSEYFEGVWIDQVKVEGAVVGYGVLTIAPAGGDNVTLNGANYNAKGENIGAFESELGKVLGHRLIYLYDAPGDKNPVSNMGRGDLLFVGRDTFSGSFFDINRKCWHQVDGKRLRGDDAHRADGGERHAIHGLIRRHFDSEA